jgi:hypothetical protein
LNKLGAGVELGTGWIEGFSSSALGTLISCNWAGFWLGVEGREGIAATLSGTGKTIGDTAAEPTREATGVVGLEPGFPGVQGDEPLAALGDSDLLIVELEGGATPAGKSSSRAFGETELTFAVAVKGEPSF